VHAAVVVFTRDLRVHDNPALAAAARAERVLPLFVFDDRALAAHASANRARFLLEALRDLDRSLRDRGARLIVRRGDWVGEVLRVVQQAGAAAVHVSADVSGYAQRREARLRAEAGRLGIEVVAHPGVTVVPPGAVTPTGGDHFKVFTPYWRRWSAVPRRLRVAAPRRLRLPPGVGPGRWPAAASLASGGRARVVPPGGEGAARRLFAAWARAGLRGYPARHDDLAGAATSHLSPYLHFGCVSPLEVVERAEGGGGGAEFARQLCWRDFFHQLLAARPDAAWADYRPRGDRWHDDPDAFTAWRDGLTGYPVVDAAMRQLRSEGFVPNRARMVVASFLTKDLYLDWRLGARHFLDWLVDGDLASNNLSWQWTAGTGTDTDPRRVFNPTVQGKRFDPGGEFVRRHVPELAGVSGQAVHDPDLGTRRACGYPAPIVDHAAAVAAYRARRRR
jgi:deoxyribodipyrimidine photo-lyase